MSVSKTGLEALACNCKAITWNGNILTKLPEEHKPENVIEELMKVYKDIIHKY